MAHFYLPDGQPFYEVPYAGKRKPDAAPKAPALSFSIKRKEAAPQARAANDVPSRAPVDDSDIPW